MNGMSLVVLAAAHAGDDLAAPGDDLGARVYASACVPCHGVNGDGSGPYAAALNPKPRDFTRGSYKFRTTASGTIPTDADLARTLDAGVPGTAMPAWRALLSVEERDAVIGTIKAFSDWFEEPVYPEDVLVTPLAKAPPHTALDVEAGGVLYERMQCAKCHGDDGRGNKDNPLTDDWGNPIVAFDFTRGIYRGGATDADIYRSLTTGLNGTPMPSYADSLTEEQRWQLVWYVQSLNRKRGLTRYLSTAPSWNHDLASGPRIE